MSSGALYDRNHKHSDITHTLPTSCLASFARLQPYFSQRYRSTSQRLGITITGYPSYSIQAGSNLIVLAHRGDRLEIVAEAARAAHQASGVQQGGTIVAVQLDVSDRAQVAALWSKVPPPLRKVDILGSFSILFGVLDGCREPITALGLPQSTMQVLDMAPTMSVIF